MNEHLSVDTPSKPGTIETIYRWGRVPGADAKGVITGATQANPVVVTSTSHGLENGERVHIADVVGMTEINNITFTVANKTTNTYELSGINGTGYGAYVSGGNWVKQNGFWFHWTGEKEVAKGPVALDTVEKTYITNGTQPLMTYSPIATSGGGTDYPTTNYRLGIPAPGAAPVATKIGASSCDAQNQTSVAYVMTYVSGVGEEGPPSSPSNIITGLCPGQQVDLSSLETGPSGNYNIISKRVYRTVTSSVGTQYQFLVELAVATTTYSDTTLAENLGEALKTVGWIEPPADMEGMCFTANGIGAGFSANALCLSVPYLPHAWPVDFRKYTDYDIVAIAATDNAIIVGTHEEPYIAIGNHPSSMTLRKINIQQGCLSKRSMRSLGSIGVIYASADGLIVISPNGSYNIITEAYFSYDEWQALNPASMHGYIWDGRYYCFYTQADGTQGGFYIDPEHMENGVIYIDDYATAGFQDKLSGKLYLMIGSQIKEFEGKVTKTSAVWRSKRFVLSRPDPYGFMRVIADDYTDISIELYAFLNETDTTMAQVMKRRVFNGEPFKLPSEYNSRKIELEFNGKSIWTTIALAESAGELAEIPG